MVGKETGGFGGHYSFNEGEKKFSFSRRGSLYSEGFPLKKKKKGSKAHRSDVEIIIGSTSTNA